MSLVDAAAAAMTHSQVVTSLREHLANGDMEGNVTHMYLAFQLLFNQNIPGNSYYM